jgi:homoserine O-acetyltransferase
LWSLFKQNIFVKKKMATKTYKYKKPFLLETGEALPEVEICYSTYGKLNRERSNVLWIIHALTANSDPVEWWPGMVGKGKAFDTDKYFIVCANNIGSCYGSTGPASINPNNGKKYGKEFPLYTIRDMVNFLELLREHLEIKKIDLSVGCSIAGQILLEWAIMKPGLIEHIVPVAANARHSAWGIAFNEAQRMAMDNSPKGLATARAIAMLSYRCYDSYVTTQTDSLDKIDDFRASSYQRYQGEKLVKRFDFDCYYSLSKAMDSHNVGRGRDSIENALAQIKSKALIISINTDVLFPAREQEFLRDNIKGAKLKILYTIYGHDGFLIEHEQLSKIIRDFLKK